MKTIRSKANVGILSPLIVPFVLALYIVWMICNRGASDSTAWGAAMGCAVVLYFVAIGTGVAFLVGLGLHGIAATRTRMPCRWAWWYSLVVCGLSMLTVRPTGTVAGAAVAVVLLTARPFKIMRKGVEQAGAGDALQRTGPATSDRR